MKLQDDEEPAAGLSADQVARLLNGSAILIEERIEMKQCRPFWRIAAINKPSDQVAICRLLLEFALLAFIVISAMRLHELLTATIK